MRGITGSNIDKLFKESAGLGQEIRNQLAGLKYAN
jgi:hypothetical protein